MIRKLCDLSSVFLAAAVLLMVSSRAGLGQASAPEVSITGALSSHSIGETELLRFTLTLKNKTGVVLNSVRLVAPPEHYSFTRICVLPPQQAEMCRSDSDFSNAGNVLVSAVGPGQDLVAWGYLTPATAHRTESLGMIAAWKLPEGSVGLPTSGVVTLGDNQVQTWYQAAWVDKLVTVLAIPTILAVISFFLNLLAKAREDRAAEREKEKEAKIADAERKKEERRQQLQREETVRTETWKQILPVSHRYALKFYVPLSSASEKLAEALLGTNRELAFFYVLFAGKRMTETRNKVGGFYFKDLRGEALAAICWRRQRDLLLGPEDSPVSLAVRSAVDLLQPNETYQSFQEEFERRTGATTSFVNEEIQEAWERFSQWILSSGNVAGVVRYLKGFYAVLDYETNRPYEYWYNPPARLQVDPETEALLRELGKHINYTEAQMHEYFETALRIRNPV